MSEPHPFIAYLINKAKKDDRKMLASLRRGLGLPPGTSLEMHTYIAPWLSDFVSDDRGKSYYLVASLFAYHPENAVTGNMGGHMALAFPTDDDKKSVNLRFNQLLAAHPDDLYKQLRYIISFLKTKKIPVNWDQLLKDITNWGHPDQFVQRYWANAFWGGYRPNKTNEQSPENEE
ncbi:MAG: type I-E CRISPR-associated protein Cse2/CasB [Anaerolineaceae bacterium]|jgi:CRISPR system Cascade subunit CasB|nr:type I-E CRISPR-associated protein Cse2/CasB [Anaerolineaceae bacterium]MDY0280583.1 type I-E CRISPR-associated protein Cse2/CasB [Salinivirgaceae bacterium]